MYLFQSVCKISGFPTSQINTTFLQDTFRKIDPVGYFSSMEVFSVFEKVQSSRPTVIVDIKMFLMLE